MRGGVGCRRDNRHAFRDAGRHAQERIKARRFSTEARVERCVEIVNASSDQWLAWCDLNNESQSLAKGITGAVDVTGSDSIEEKEQAMADFASGKARRAGIQAFNLRLRHELATLPQ